MKTLCIGEAMAELAPSGSEKEFRIGFAGDTFNTAWYMKQLLGSPVSFFSAVGDDSLSTEFVDFLKGAGLDGTDIARKSGKSLGLYMISLNNGERSFSYWRDTSAAKLLAEDKATLAKAMDEVELVYFSGITLAILSPEHRRNLFSALKSARAKGRIIAFDPNLRPRLWPNTEMMTSTIMEAAEVSDIALPSYEDESVFFGDSDPDATVARYKAAGVMTVIVKNGHEAIRFREGDASGTVEVSSVKSVVDSTAAGDSFNAGVFAGMAKGLPTADQIALGSKVAAQVIGAKGALVDLNIQDLNLR